MTWRFPVSTQEPVPVIRGESRPIRRFVEKELTPTGIIILEGRTGYVLYPRMLRLSLQTAAAGDQTVDIEWCQRTQSGDIIVYWYIERECPESGEDYMFATGIDKIEEDPSVDWQKFFTFPDIEITEDLAIHLSIPAQSGFYMMIYDEVRL